MGNLIGIRREDKNIWERRVPLIPEHVKTLVNEKSIDVIIQPFEKRTFSDAEYIEVGAKVNEDISEASIILAVKEIPINLLLENKTYLFFSHTIKGQKYNMPLLQKLIDLKCTLIDYEVITNEKGQRLVFFGKYAGYAGMIDGLSGLGKRLQYLGYNTPFSLIKSAYQYADLEEAKEVIKHVGKIIDKNGLPDELIPLNFGFTGYGNVSKGAQEIFNLLPHTILTPTELLNQKLSKNNTLYKTVFTESDMFETKDANYKFDLQDYFNFPEKYKSQFDKYLHNLDVMINAIYWHDKCPRLVTKKYVKKKIADLKIKLITDITCDIDGAIEFTTKATEPDNPAFVFNPQTGSIVDGYKGEGIVNITVDNLPTELPKNSSIEFGNSLFPFIEGLVNADTTQSFEEVNYPQEIKNGVILFKGELTEKFKYLGNFLDSK